MTWILTSQHTTSVLSFQNHPDIDLQVCFPSSFCSVIQGLSSFNSQENGLSTECCGTEFHLDPDAAKHSQFVTLLSLCYTCFSIN